MLPSYPFPLAPCILGDAQSARPFGPWTLIVSVIYGCVTDIPDGSATDTENRSVPRMARSKPNWPAHRKSTSLSHIAIVFRRAEPVLSDQARIKDWAEPVFIRSDPYHRLGRTGVIRSDPYQRLESPLGGGPPEDRRVQRRADTGCSGWGGTGIGAASSVRRRRCGGALIFMLCSCRS